MRNGDKSPAVWRPQGIKSPALRAKIRSREDLRVYQDTDMTKLLLVFLAVLAVAAITSARQLEQDSSLSEDLAFSRIARSPEADAKRKSRRPKSRASKRKNKSRRQRKRKTRKSKKRGGKRGKKQKVNVYKGSKQVLQKEPQ